MRSIDISTDVFAELWARRKEGEESEDKILRRLLGLGKPKRSEPSSDGRGFYSDRYNVQFKEGFRIFRMFKGQEFVAVARDRKWVLNGNGKSFSSLSDLSQGIGTGIENVWMSWKYRDPKGGDRPISDLRDPKTIHRRRKRA